VIAGFVIVVTGICIAAVDPASVRAVARRNELLLQQGEDALARGDAATALARALAIDSGDRRLSRRRHLLLRGRARASVGLVDDARLDLGVARDGLADNDAERWVIGRELAGLARSRGDFDACASELLVVAARQDLTDDDAVLLATCLRGTARAGEAHDALAGRSSSAARQLRARILLEDGLPRIARADVEALVAGSSTEELLRFAAAFRRAGDGPFATALIDAAVARAPDDVDAAAALVDDRAGPGRVERAARVAPGLGDRLRTEGRLRAASYAALVEDASTRLRGRLALLVERRAWDRVLALAPRLAAAGIRDDDVAYALAFAALAVGRFDDADLALDGVSGAGSFARATALRAAIAGCRAAVAQGDRQEQERQCPR
jgi:hypothetical protein